MTKIAELMLLPHVSSDANLFPMEVNIRPFETYWKENSTCIKTRKLQRETTMTTW